jgi:hypothetical protein
MFPAPCNSYHEASFTKNDLVLHLMNLKQAQQVLHQQLRLQSTLTTPLLIWYAAISALKVVLEKLYGGRAASRSQSLLCQLLYTNTTIPLLLVTQQAHYIMPQTRCPPPSMARATHMGFPQTSLNFLLSEITCAKQLLILEQRSRTPTGLSIHHLRQSQCTWESQWLALDFSDHLAQFLTSPLVFRSTPKIYLNRGWLGGHWSGGQSLRLRQY